MDLSVHAEGSVLRGISGEETLAAAELALDTWTDVRCDDQRPSLDRGLVELGDESFEFNRDRPNVNVIRFVDSGWPGQKEALAKTILNLNLDTGEILDADILLNSETFSFALEPASNEVDLVAVLTHEVGHLLGFDHSAVPGATMQPDARGFATAELLDLEPDDRAAMCAAYPPKPEAPPSRIHADSADDEGGCSIGHERRRGVEAGVATLLAGVCALARRRTKRTR